MKRSRAWSAPFRWLRMRRMPKAFRYDSLCWSLSSNNREVTNCYSGVCRNSLIWRSGWSSRGYRTDRQVETATTIWSVVVFYFIRIAVFLPSTEWWCCDHKQTESDAGFMQVDPYVGLGWISPWASLMNSASFSHGHTELSELQQAIFGEQPRKSP